MGGGGVRRSYSGGVKYEGAGGLLSGIRNVWAQDNIRRHLPFTKKIPNSHGVSTR